MQESFPESEDDGTERVKQNVMQQIKLLEEQQGKLVADIIITHGHSVERTFSVYDKSLNFNARIYPYCEVTIYKITKDGEEIEILLGASDDHVQTKTNIW